MKDIQMIMKEINNISDEIAVGLGVDDALLAGLADVSPNLSCTCGAACGGTGGELPDCASLVTIPATVLSTCVVTAPCGFTFPIDDVLRAGLRIAYNLNFLTFRIQACNCDDTTRYAVIVSGHIPYIVNIPIVTDTAGVCTSTADDGDEDNNEIFACCHNCAIVDDIGLGFACTPIEAWANIIAIRTRLSLCEGISVSAPNAVSTGPFIANVPVTFTFAQCTTV